MARQPAHKDPALQEDRQTVAALWAAAGGGRRGSVARLAKAMGTSTSRAWQLVDRFKLREPATWDVPVSAPSEPASAEPPADLRPLDAT